MWRFPPTTIMHRLPVKFAARSRSNSAARRKGTVITLTEIIGVIHMTVETSRTVIIRAGPDKHAVCKPFRTIVAVRCTVVWRGLVIPIRAHGRTPANRDSKMCRPARTPRETSQSKCKNTDVSHCLHRVYPYLLEPVGREAFLEELSGKLVRA